LFQRAHVTRGVSKGGYVALVSSSGGNKVRSAGPSPGTAIWLGYAQSRDLSRIWHKVL